ncbi:tellurite resistance TerB C-terminal domain-containing protein [Pedobacter immunditicola]|uniref:tellurite resistance TerB C-terminal domain-containing protein n=1 Tax=Pedobacter immunditicola TaxID=3133440 RepID=UPI0030B371E8
MNYLAVYSDSSRCLNQRDRRLFEQKDQYINRDSVVDLLVAKSVAVEASVENESFRTLENVINKIPLSIETTFTAYTSISSVETEADTKLSTITKNLSYLVQNAPQTQEKSFSGTIQCSENELKEKSVGGEIGVIMAWLIDAISARADAENKAYDIADGHEIATIKVADVLRFPYNKLHLEILKDNSFDSTDINGGKQMSDFLKQRQSEIHFPDLVNVRNNLIESKIRKTTNSVESAHYDEEETMEIQNISLEENECLAVKNIDEVIDIDEEDEPIDLEKLSFDPNLVVPSWPHRYIYSTSDLDHASQKQKDFYKKFKDAFYEGSCIDTVGNSNYYFVLLFDLLEDYEKHGDLTILEKRIDRLSAAYPRTRGYARKFLLGKMREAAYTLGITRLESRMSEESTSMSWDWRNQYRDKLNLSKEDLQILEKIYLPSNTFVSNAFCATELVKLYIRSIKSLDKAYQSKGLEKDKEFNIVLDLIARKEYRYHRNSSNYNYQLKHGSGSICGYILKYCEQLLRTHYHFKKLSGFERQFTHVMVNEAIKEHIMIHIEESLPELLIEIAPLNEETERALYTLHHTRWKSVLLLEEECFQEKGRKKFLQYAEHIIELNNSNASLENIYLELSKFLVNLDSQTSLEYYLRYTAQNISERKLVLKEMSKTMSKKLFKEPKSHTRFLHTLIKLIKTEVSIEEALLEIKGFYEPLRKRIKLDEKAIKKVQIEFSGTVGLLGEFLSYEDLIQEIVAPEVTATPLIVDTIVEQINPENNNNYKIDLSQIESGLLDLFSEHALSLDKVQIADYCQSTGSMQNVLINSLNENCYDLIDDLLIERNDDSYNINEDYYAQIKNI